MDEHCEGEVDVRWTFDGRFAADFLFGVPVVLRVVDGEPMVVDFCEWPLPILDAVLTGIFVQ